MRRFWLSFSWGRSRDVRSRLQYLKPWLVPEELLLRWLITGLLPLLCRPFHSAAGVASQYGCCFSQSQRSRKTRQEVLNISMTRSEITHHHFSFILFIRSESQCSAHSKKEKLSYTLWREHERIYEHISNGYQANIGVMTQWTLLCGPGIYTSVGRKDDLQ